MSEVAADAELARRLARKQVRRRGTGAAKQWIAEELARAKRG